jgi:hypothetical protein
MGRSDAGRGRAEHRHTGQNSSEEPQTEGRAQTGTADARQGTGPGYGQSQPGRQTTGQSEQGHNGRAGGSRSPTRRPSFNRTTLRAIAVVFGLLGALSLYVGVRVLSLGSDTPVGGSEIQMVGVLTIVVGVAHVYAGYGVWRLRRRGWLVGMGLVGLGLLFTLVGLTSRGAGGVLVGIVVNAALGLGLYANREPFLDQRPARADTASDTRQTGEPGRETTGGVTSGYASERRGRH